jgi:hypothetical protein
MWHSKHVSAQYLEYHIKSPGVDFKVGSNSIYNFMYESLNCIYPGVDYLLRLY